jgi:hypothetical protein
MRLSRDGDEEEDEERWRPALFFFSRWLYIYSQKAILRNISARIKWALYFSIAIVQPKFMKIAIFQYLWF